MESDPKDIGSLEKALNDAAGKASALWTTFVTFELYFAIAFGSVTHRDLLLDRPIKLPILNVDLPLVGFFVIAPAVLAIFQFYVFLQLFALTKKAEEYDSLLREQVPLAADGQYLRQRLDSFLILQFLVGPREQRSGPTGFWLRLVAWITLVVAPILVLLQAQFTFLPYHNTWVLWFQRSTILLTLIAVWYYWTRIVGSGRLVKSFAPKALLILVSWTATAAIALCSVCVATFPGEWADDTFPRVSLIPISWSPLWSRQEDWTSFHKLLFAGEINEVRSRPMSLFSDRLVVTDQTIIDPDAKADTGISLRGRDLRRAILSRTDLRKADFTGANLDQASIDSAKLEGAKFGCAAVPADKPDKKGGEFLTPDERWPLDGCTWLRMANLSESQLQGANFDGARLQGAVFNAANLHGANFAQARLQGSSIDHAILDGALFIGARLQGASIERSEVWGADFSTANLSASWLFESQFQGVNLQDANMKGAIMNGALIWHTAGKPINVEEMRWGAPSHNSEKDQISQRPFTQNEFSNWRIQTKKMLSYHQTPEYLQSNTDFLSLDPTRTALENATPKSVWEHANKTGSLAPLALVQSVACGTEAAYEILKKMASLSFGYAASDVRNLIAEMKRADTCPGVKVITKTQFDDIESDVRQNLDSLGEQTNSLNPSAQTATKHR
jgi:uncharacterized protein YjbI with pentapeptide repeats